MKRYQITRILLTLHGCIRFKAIDTVKSDFWIDTKKSVDVDMMAQNIGPLHYAEIDDVQILKLKNSIQV